MDEPHKVEVVLTPDQMAFGKYIGEGRQQGKFWRPDKSWTQTPVEVQILGARGELAVGNLLGLSINTEFYGACGDKGAGDLFCNGYSLEVKTRSKRDWDFCLGTTDPLDMKSDFGILVWPGITKGRTFTIVGYVTRERFLREWELIKLKDWRAGMKWRKLNSGADLPSVMAQACRNNTASIELAQAA